MFSRAGCCSCCSSRWLLFFALCATGVASAILYASIGPDSWVVYSNLAFLVPAAAAVLRHSRWLLCALFILTGAASVAYHNTAVTGASSLRELQQTDHVAALYITVVVLTLPFKPTRDSRLANGIALALGAGATVAAVWFTLETELEPITGVAVTLGTLLLGHWLQFVFAVVRLGDEWRRAQAWNLVWQAVPPVAIGVPLGLEYAWNPYTVASIFGVALLWPFMMQSILAKQSDAWPNTSLGLTVRQIDLHPFKAAGFILVTLLLGISALTLLWTPATTNDWQWHGLWHVLAAATATFVIWNAPAPFSDYGKLQG